MKMQSISLKPPTWIAKRCRLERYYCINCDSKGDLNMLDESDVEDGSISSCLETSSNRKNSTDSD